MNGKRWLTNRGGRVAFAGAGIALLALLTLFVSGIGTSRDLPTAEVRRGDFLVSLTETGELRASRSRVVTAPPVRTSLQIIYLAPKGEVVEKGDTLIIFDGTDLRKNIDEAQSELEIAQANLEKSRSSIASNLAQLQASLESAQASYRIAELRLQQMQFEADVVKEEQQLALRQSEIQLTQARERIEQQKIIDEADLRTMNLRVEQARANLLKAKRDLAKLTVVAPQPGMVVYKKIWKGGDYSEVKIGDQPWRGQALIELPDLSDMEVETTIGEVDVSKVRAGQVAKIVLDAFPDREFSGTVKEVSTLAREDDNSSGEAKVFDVIITVHESDPILKPGMTVSTTIIIEEIADTLSIPLDAVFPLGDRQVVYRAGGGGFRPVDVLLGSRNDNFVVVREGLAEGDRVSLVDPTKPFDAAAWAGGEAAGAMKGGATGGVSTNGSENTGS
ncbi:MAG TPA: HlyD family efflux transporter periplasmic adaptor subunit [Bacteroidetes bacterium]|nr:HlyD family efflux transporter periplasmic adaptor subunit [Bacteroidota bacterium]